MTKHEYYFDAGKLDYNEVRPSIKELTSCEVKREVVAPPLTPEQVKEINDIFRKHKEKMVSAPQLLRVRAESALMQRFPEKFKPRCHLKLVDPVA